MVKNIFEALRKELLALDPCVTEEFLKSYVAYKAETNFVDIVSQAKKLKLYFNIDFADINEPKNLCEDVTNQGHWGNGNVVFDLDKMENVQYAVGLARQALERQLGEDERE